MTWLDGLPVRVRPLKWSSEADTFRRKAGSTSRRITHTRVLDDLICTFMTYMLDDGHRETAVYLGDIKSGQDTILMEQIATIPLYLVSIELLLRNGTRTAVFVSIEVLPEESEIILRVHSRDGSTLKQQSVPATAAFGRLVVHEDSVAICISSGEEPEDEPDYFYSDFFHYQRIDYIPDVEISAEPGVPDTIICWDFVRDSLYRVKVPQSKEFLMLHSGDFGFVASDKIALAGVVEPSVADINAGLLKCFSVHDQPTFLRTFAQTGDLDAEIGKIYRSVGIPGSSDPSNIFLHYYDGTGRVSVFHKDLLSGNIKITEPNNKLIDATEYLSSHRAVRGHLSVKHLPSVAGNRALLKGSMSSASSNDPHPLLILDFDSQRIHRLLSLDESARNNLSERFGDRNACIQVITRRSILWAHLIEEDGEYSAETRPAEWGAHINELHTRDAERSTTGDKLPPLEFDEAPEEHRSEDLFGCSASRLQLPDDVEQENIAITTSALVEVAAYPFDDGFEQGWRVFDFEGESSE